MRLRELRQARHAWMKVNTIWAQVSTTYLGLLRSLGLKHTNYLVLLCFARGLFCSHIQYYTFPCGPCCGVAGGCRSGREMSGSVGWCAARRRHKEAEGKVQDSCKRRGGVGGVREGGEGGARTSAAAAEAGMHAAARARQYGWVAAPRTATSDERRRRLGGPCSGASRRARPRAARPQARRAGRPPSIAPRASPAERARANALSSSGPAAHRGSRHLAPAVARHACQRPARHQLPPASAPAADHAATLWQWCWATNWARGAKSPRTWWAIYAADAHRPRGTGSVFGTNSRATRRAGELAAADPANRVRGLAVVCSSANAEGRKGCRAARRSGTSRRRPSPTGHSAAARAFGAL